MHIEVSQDFRGDSWSVFLRSQVWKSTYASNVMRSAAQAVADTLAVMFRVEVETIPFERRTD